MLSDLTIEKKLPKRCFISHSYDDAQIVENLQRKLADDTESVIFPREDPDPNNAVSNNIIPTILECPGLIYLATEASGSSFWVSFERDYALRADKKVFSYDPSNQGISVDKSSPLSLDVTLAYHISDEERVEKLISWMENERHFKIDATRLRSNFGGLTGDMVLSLEYLLLEGGVILWLLGTGNHYVAERFYNHDFLEYIKQSGTEYKPGIDGKLEYENTFQQIYDVFARIDPSLDPDWAFSQFSYRPYRKPIDLYENQEAAFNWNRIDDFIIQTYSQVLQQVRYEGQNRNRG